MTKKVTRHLGAAYQVANLVCQVATYYDFIEVFHLKKDAFGRPVLDAHGHPVKDFLYKENLKDAEKEHVKNGGRLIVLHACGKEFHISVPKPF